MPGPKPSACLFNHLLTFKEPSISSSYLALLGRVSTKEDLGTVRRWPNAGLAFLIFPMVVNLHRHAGFTTILPSPLARNVPTLR